MISAWQCDGDPGIAFIRLRSNECDVLPCHGLRNSQKLLETYKLKEFHIQTSENLGIWCPCLSNSCRPALLTALHLAFSFCVSVVETDVHSLVLLPFFLILFFLLYLSVDSLHSLCILLILSDVQPQQNHRWRPSVDVRRDKPSLILHGLNQRCMNSWCTMMAVHSGWCFLAFKALKQLKY